MTLRDWYAWNASEFDIRRFQNVTMVEKCARETARYRFADAMLAARLTHPEKKGGA
jgi:hypothetical protein